MKMKIVIIGQILCLKNEITNVDKIRNMSDEELAEFLCKVAKYGNPYIDMWRQWINMNTL